MLIDVSSVLEFGHVFLLIHLFKEILLMLDDFKSLIAFVNFLLALVHIGELNPQLMLPLFLFPSDFVHFVSRMFLFLSEFVHPLFEVFSLNFGFFLDELFFSLCFGPDFAHHTQV